MCVWLLSVCQYNIPLPNTSITRYANIEMICISATHICLAKVPRYRAIRSSGNDLQSLISANLYTVSAKRQLTSQQSTSQQSTSHLALSSSSSPVTIARVAFLAFSRVSNWGKRWTKITHTIYVSASESTFVSSSVRHCMRKRESLQRCYQRNANNSPVHRWNNLPSERLSDYNDIYVVFSNDNELSSFLLFEIFAL